MSLGVGSVSQTVEVTATAPIIDTSQVQAKRGSHGAQDEEKDRLKHADQPPQGASANVFNLQKKIAGVLPVRVDVPRAGSSYLFARALVLDEETKLTFSYKTK